MHREQRLPASPRAPKRDPATRASSPPPARPPLRRLFPRRAALLAPILLALAGCDNNVEWGGVEVEIVPPPPLASIAPDSVDEEAATEFGLPRGPVLFHIQKTAQGSLLVPVAELAGDSLRSLRRPEGMEAGAFEQRFRETVLPIGAQVRLFRRGTPVGTFVAQRPGPTTACGLPTALGNATVVAAAADAPQFLGFREGLAPQVRGDFNPPQINGSIRTYASIVAEKLILQAGLPRPRSWTGAQRDLDAIEILPGGHPEMVATYLVGDSLAAGPSDPQGYSVFYVGDYETQRGYNPIYSEVRDYRRTGKAAPRLVDYLNWTGDGNPELLVQVFGRNDSWYEAIGQRGRGSRWGKVWEQERCGG